MTLETDRGEILSATDNLEQMLGTALSPSIQRPNAVEIYSFLAVN
jgi:hypothetical protein